MSIIEVKNLDEYEIQKLEIYRDREEEKDGILTPPPPPNLGPSSSAHSDTFLIVENAIFSVLHAALDFNRPRRWKQVTQKPRLRVILRPHVIKLIFCYRFKENIREFTDKTQIHPFSLGFHE